MIATTYVEWLRYEIHYLEREKYDIECNIPMPDAEQQRRHDVVCIQLGVFQRALAEYRLRHPDPVTSKDRP